jgi:hypothetical protein
MVNRNRDFLCEIAEHLTFLAVTDNLAKALKLLEKHLGWALAALELLQKFDFLNAGRFLLGRLTAASKESVRLRLPREFPGWQESGRYEVAGLRAWFDREAETLAAQFDARNGNDGFTKALAEVQQLDKLVTPCPLRGA